MKIYEVVGYAYEADLHCVICILEDARKAVNGVSA